MRHAFLPYAIAFRKPVGTGAGAWRTRRGAWLRCEEEGFTGMGEAAPLEPLESDAAAAEAVERAPYRDAAFSLAELDIEGQRNGVSLAGLWGPDFRRSVACNALLFAAGVEAAAAEAERACEQGFRTLKLKVGAASPEDDIARVAEIRRRVGPGPRLRIDANGAWDVATAIRVLSALEPFDIAYVEDPVRGDVGPVRLRVGVPIAADVRSLEDGWRVVGLGSADCLVLKPMALGTLQSVRELALAAIEAGIGVVITSVFDTAVGVAGALHLAASLPGPEQAHGLATVSLLDETPLLGLEPPREGRLELPHGPGLGVHMIGDETRQAKAGR